MMDIKRIGLHNKCGDNLLTLQEKYVLTKTKIEINLAGNKVTYRT